MKSCNHFIDIYDLSARVWEDNTGMKFPPEVSRFVLGRAGSVCMSHHLIPSKRGKVCILEPGLFPASAFHQFIGYSNAQSTRALCLQGSLSTLQISWTTAGYCRATTACIFFFWRVDLDWAWALVKYLKELVLKSVQCFDWTNGFGNNVLVKR